MATVRVDVLVISLFLKRALDTANAPRSPPVSRAKMHEPPKPKTAKRKGGAAKKAAHDEHEEAEASEEEEPEAEHEPPTPKKAKAAHKKTARKVISV